MTIHTFTIYDCHSKCGQMFRDPENVSRPIIMSKQMGEYLKWKKRESIKVQKQLPLEWIPLKRVEGMIVKVVLSPSRPGRSPDLFNLLGAVADVLTDATVWVDDSTTVCDIIHSKISYNTSKLTIVNLFTTIDDYRNSLEKVIQIL